MPDYAIPEPVFRERLGHILWLVHRYPDQTDEKIKKTIAESIKAEALGIATALGYEYEDVYSGSLRLIGYDKKVE